MSNVIEFTIRGVDKASGAFKSFGNSAVAATKKVAAAAVQLGKRLAVAFIAAAAATFALMKRVASMQDAVGKMSTRLGIAVDKLSEFHHAAELGGITTAQFDMALQRMTRRVAEAGEGLGEAKSALVELNLNAKELSKLPVDEQMNRVADALNGVTNQSDKVRLAFKLFDSEGVGLLQTMKNGSQSFKDAAADLEYLGGVMNAQGVANSEKFQDALTRMGVAFDGLSLTIGETLIPIMTGLINKFANFIADNRVAFTNFIKGLIVGFLQFGFVVGQVASKIGEVFSNLFDVNTMAETLGNIMQGFADMLSGVVTMFLDVAPYLAGILITSFRAGWEAFKELAKGALDHVFDFLTGNNIAKPFGEIVADAVRAAQSELAIMPDLMGSVSDIIIENAEATGNALRDMFGINMELAKEQAEEMLAGIAEFGEVVTQIQEEQEEKIPTFIDRLREQMTTFLADQQDFTAEFAKSVFKTMMDATNAVGAGIAGIIVDGNKASEVFKQIAKDIAKQLITTYIAVKLQRIIAAKLTPSEAGANMMATMSAAPFPINLSAPALAASHAAIAAGYAGGVAHGGLDFVPRESTFLLDKGERVLSPRQNSDLTSFLRGGGSGGGTTVNVYTTASTFGDITDAELEDFVGDRLLRTLDRLEQRGIKQQALERGSV